MAYGLDFYALDRPLRDTLRYYLGGELGFGDLGVYSSTVVYEVAYRVDWMSRPWLVYWSAGGRGARGCGSTPRRGG